MRRNGRKERLSLPMAGGVSIRHDPNPAGRLHQLIQNQRLGFISDLICHPLSRPSPNPFASIGVHLRSKTDSFDAAVKANLSPVKGLQILTPEIFHTRRVICGLTAFHAGASLVLVSARF
jgi:hypothetical protein